MILIALSPDGTYIGSAAAEIIKRDGKKLWILEAPPPISITLRM